MELDEETLAELQGGYFDIADYKSFTIASGPLSGMRKGPRAKKYNDGISRQLRYARRNKEKLNADRKRWPINKAKQAEWYKRNRERILANLRAKRTSDKLYAQAHKAT